MKTKIIILAVLFFTLIMAGIVSASLEISDDSLTIEVSYDSLNDKDDEIAINQTISISNNGNSTENVSVSLDGLSSKYDLSVSPSSLSIVANGSSDIKISGEIPVDVDSGDHDIGSLIINGASEGTITKTLKTDVQPMLEIKNIYVYINDKKVETINDDDEKVGDDFVPGDEIELKFKLRNLFDSNYDYGDIGGDININLDEGDFGNDINEEESFDVGADDDEEYSLFFTVPEDADEDTYTLEIEVDGEDENSAQYLIDWNLEFKVNRAKDDVRIESISLSPTELSCFRRADLTVKTTNYGSNDQKYAALSIESSALNIDMDYQFELQEGSDDDSVTKLLSIDLDKDFPAGTYTISATAYYDYNVYADKENVNLVVKDCPTDSSSSSSSTSDEDNDTKDNSDDKSTTNTDSSTTDTSTAASDDDTNVNTNSTSQLSSSDVVKTTERSYSKDDFIIALFIIAIVVILAVVILLFVALFR